MQKFRHIAPLALLTLSVPLWAATSTAPAKKKDVKSPSSVEVRDWKAIDTNGDHLISPEEMEKYLHASPGPQQKKKTG